MTVARGEYGAFGALFRQLAGPVYRMALAVTRDRAQAEEVSQEALIEIWRTAGLFDPRKGSAGVGHHDCPPARLALAQIPCDPEPGPDLPVRPRGYSR